MINQDKLTKAWFFASEAHKNQKYPKANLPYITHIGNVMMEVMAVASSLENAELAICCAILHDTIEDSKVTYDEIQTEFGKEVADGILALSKNPTFETKREKMLDSLERIKAQSKAIWAVKMADRIANLGEPPSHWNLEKIEAYRDEALIILDYLGAGNEFLAKRLEEKIKNYEKQIKEKTCHHS